MSETKRWRIIRNGWNICDPPWRGAIGIEEINDEFTPPSIVCWFCQGWPKELAQHVIDLHNASIDGHL